MGEKLKANEHQIEINDELDIFLYFADQGAVTDMHFDGVPRLLRVIRGQKKVILFPPEDSLYLYPTANYQIGYSHGYPFRRRSLLNGCLHRREVLEEYVKRFPLFKRSRPLSFTINEGETLFLPECWWHYFHSTGDVTINVVIDLEEDLNNRLDKAIGCNASPYSPQERFVPLVNRSYKTVTRSCADSFDDYKQRMKEIKSGNLTWKNYCLSVDPYTLQTYTQLLQDLRPNTIFEFGAGSGGLSVWMRDQLNALGTQCSIHSFAPNEDVFEAGDEHGITFHPLVHNESSAPISSELLEELVKITQGPCLVVVNDNQEIRAVLNTIVSALKIGDYVLIGNTLAPDTYRELLEFSYDHPEFLVDTYYCDLSGYNSGFHINSILKKCDA
jgi:cephalosporin hydroxylase